MKRTILLFTFLSVIFGLSAQVPQSFKYQAVARNNDNAAIKNQKIGLKVEIRQGSLSGTAVYTETFRVTSNNIGVFSVDIGTGSPVKGSFPEIDWGAGDHFLNIKMDVKGGTKYKDMGTTQLLSVPYSLYTGSIYVNYSNDTLYIGDQYVIISGGGTPSGNTVTDYDGIVYNTVKIGSQVWMQENLRSLHYADGAVIDSVWVYDNNESNAAVWGRLYDWNAATHGTNSSGRVQGACPTGFHLPTKEEFEQLRDYLGGGNAWKLKDPSSAYWGNSFAKNTNESKFSARGAGSRENIYGNYRTLKAMTRFWSSTENSSNKNRAYTMKIYDNQGAAVVASDNKKMGFSIRCIKD
jgi:uncharacterized protein (TIGR02145 family)